MFEGWLANGIAAGGQLTTTSDVENFPGFPEGITGLEITDKFRAQSERFGTKIFSETVTKIDLSSRPFKLETDEKEVVAETVIIATGAVAKKLEFPGSGEGEGGYWNKGISACAVGIDLDRRPSKREARSASLTSLLFALRASRSHSHSLSLSHTHTHTHSFAPRSFARCVTGRRRCSGTSRLWWWVVAIRRARRRTI